MTKVKDCVYGQVRATEDEDISQGVLMPHVIPDGWKQYITKQQLFTWTNHTGMNPLWDQSPIDDVTYFRYGDMLTESQYIEEDIGLNVMELITYENGEKWDEMLAQAGPDFTNNGFALKIKILAQWYLMHQFLNAPDALDYDYLILRQHDTSFKIENDSQVLGVTFEDIKDFFFHTKNKQIPSYSGFIMVRHLYANETIDDKLLINGIGANFFIFDRKAVATLRKDFFRQIIKQAAFYSNTLIPDCRQIARTPGPLLMDVAIKNDVHLINMGEKFFWKPPRRIQKRYKDHSCMIKNRKTWD